MTKLKFHNDDINTIFNISRFIFDEKYDKITDIYNEKNISSELAMVIGCITESQKLINNAIKSEQKGGTVNMCKALEELDLDADFAKPLYDFVLKHIDLSETDIISKNTLKCNTPLIFLPISLYNKVIKKNYQHTPSIYWFE